MRLTGVARIFSGGTVFPQKVDDLLLVLNTHAKTTELTTPILQLSPPSKQIWLLAPPGGALTTYPYKFLPQLFSPPWGCTCTYCTPWLRLWDLIWYLVLAGWDLSEGSIQDLRVASKIHYRTTYRFEMWEWDSIPADLPVTGLERSFYSFSLIISLYFFLRLFLFNHAVQWHKTIVIQHCHDRQKLLDLIDWMVNASATRAEWFCEPWCL